MDTFHIKIIFHQEFSKGIGVPCSDMLTSVPDMFTLRTANLIFFQDPRHHEQGDRRGKKRPDFGQHREHYGAVHFQPL